MKNVLIINQSAELYGADKALLELIENFPENYVPIVVLHQEGPLKKRLEELGIKVIKSSVIKVKRGILTPAFFLKLPFETIRSIYKIRKELKGIEISIVHSNAISVFIGAFYSLFLRKKHIWHVHEIIEHPEFLAKIYPKVVFLLSNRIIFNSNASFGQFLKMKSNVAKKSIIIHNGQKRLVEKTSEKDIKEIKRTFFKTAHEEDVVIGLVGRISRLKGQKLLLKSFRMLLAKHPNIHLVYIGSAPDGQEHYLENLMGKINEYGLSLKVTVIDFQENIWPFYDAIDIAVVPSTEPESFGLVATEAMLSTKPVVGSDIGGLTEIIIPGQTGYLFKNKDAEDLANKLELLLLHPNDRKTFGEKGQQRVSNAFSTEKYVNGIEKIYSETISGSF